MKKIFLFISLSLVVTLLSAQQIDTKQNDVRFGHWESTDGSLDHYTCNKSIPHQICEIIVKPCKQINTPIKIVIPSIGKTIYARSRSENTVGNIIYISVKGI